jgi:glucokinase
MKSDDLFIGIDLGGTNVRAGAITADARLINVKEAPIEAHMGPKYGIEKISSLIESVVKETPQAVAAIGIGSTGPLDRERGAIQNPYTLPGWHDVDIVSPLKKRFGVPVALENDADSAALGESWAGGGRYFDRLAMITIGTGIGSGFVFNGEIYRGVSGYHPEGGHIIVDPSGPQCYCGAHGCWESLVSGPAIAKFARTSARLKSSSIFVDCRGQPDTINATMVFKAASEGDSLAKEIVEQSAVYIGLGLISVIMLYLPDCIVLSGGVIRSYSLLKNKIAQIIAHHDKVVPIDKVHIIRSKLDQSAGLFGAARAAQLLLIDETK